MYNIKIGNAYILYVTLNAYTQSLFCILLVDAIELNSPIEIVVTGLNAAFKFPRWLVG